jgi:hypothetical protein
LIDPYCFGLHATALIAVGKEGVEDVHLVVEPGFLTGEVANQECRSNPPVVAALDPERQMSKLFVVQDWRIDVAAKRVTADLECDPVLSQSGRPIV